MTLVLRHEWLAQIVVSSLIIINTGVVIQELSLVVRRVPARLLAHEEGDAEDHDSH